MIVVLCSHENTTLEMLVILQNIWILSTILCYHRKSTREGARAGLP